MTIAKNRRPGMLNGQTDPKNKVPRPPRKAMVLIAVLVVVVILALAAYRYADLMMAEYQASDNVVRSIQARSLAKSGVNFVAAILSDPNSVDGILGGNPIDNPEMFQGQVVHHVNTQKGNGMFTIFAPSLPSSTDSGNYTYGVVDEAAKINLNAMMKLDSKGDTLYNMLLKLPNMNESIAAAIVDWMDEDEEPREGGAESNAYGGLSPSYKAKNGPLDSLEELLLVQGVTPELLFGNDTNRNGIIDGQEQSTNPLTDLGWAGFLTIYSREQNVDSTHQGRVYLNDEDLTSLNQKLDLAIGQDLATYVMLARMYGTTSLPTSSSSSGGSGTSTSNSGSNTTTTNSSTQSNTSSKSSGSGASNTNSSSSNSNSSNNNNGSSSNTVTSTTMPTGQLDLTKGGKKRLSSIFDLVNSQVTVPGSGNNAKSTIYLSPLNDPGTLKTLFPNLWDKTTLSQKPEIPARINILTAPQSVLEALPDLEINDVQAILGARPQPGSANLTSPQYQSPGWLMSDANLQPDVVKKLEKYITTRTQVYRFQVVGHFDNGGPVTRVEAVVDVNAGRPRILYFRDLSSLGKGFDVGP